MLSKRKMWELLSGADAGLADQIRALRFEVGMIKEGCTYFTPPFAAVGTLFQQPNQELSNLPAIAGAISGLRDSRNEVEKELANLRQRVLELESPTPKCSKCGHALPERKEK